MAELVYGDDHRHSLAPIHTSSTTSRKNVTTLNLLLNDVYHESISSLANYDKLDHHSTHSFQVSPPSSATSSTSSTLTHVSFFHTSASTPCKGQLFTKSNSNSSMYTITSLDHHHHNMMAMRRPHGLFQSFLCTSRKVPTPRHRGGGGPVSPPTTSAFTMMPANVVGKKKPPGYVSDEPTSPEVTCMGRVRRNKHCKAWDALVMDMETAEKCYNASGSGNNNSSGIGSGSGNSSKPRLKYRCSTPRSSSVAMNCSNVVVPRPLPQPATFNRWKAFLGNMGKDMKLHIPNLTTKLHKLHRSFTGRSASGCAPAVEDFVIADLLRRRRARSSHPGRSRRSAIKDERCASDAMAVVKENVDVSGPEEEDNEVRDRVKVDEAVAPDSIGRGHHGIGRDSYFYESESEVSGQENCCPSDTDEKPEAQTSTLPNCLRLMRNSSRRKVFHSNDDDGDGGGDGDEHDIGTCMKGVQSSHDGDQCHVGYNSDDDDDDDDDGNDDVDHNKNVLMSRNNVLVRTSDTALTRTSSKGIKNLFGRRPVNQHG